MSVSGTSKFEIDVAGIFYGRSTPLHPTRPHKAPTEGSLWCVFPFAYKPTIAWNSPTDPYFSHHPPWDLAALQSVGDLGQTTAWQPGVGITMGNGQQAHWDGNSWEAGPVPLPLATQVTVGNPGVFGPANHRDPVTKAELDTINGGATWVVTGRLGDYVRVGNQDYYWNGSAWIQGRAPEKTSTTATAGSPGSFDAKRPADLNELQALTPNPSTKWATGQYVTTADGMDYHWDGNSWQGGRVTAALATGVNAGTPGTFTPPGSRAPLTKAELDTIPGSQSAWVAGQYVNVGGTEYYWDWQGTVQASSWHVGRVPSGPSLATGVTEGLPGVWYPTNSIAPTSKAQLDTIPGGPAWSTPGSWVSIGPLATDEYYWNGTQWVQGRVPGLSSGSANFTPNGGGMVTGPGALTPNPGGALPNSFWIDVYRTQTPPSFSMKWGTFSSGTVVSAIIRMVDSGGIERWRTSTSSSNVLDGTMDFTTSIPAGYNMPAGSFVYVEFKRSDGSTTIMRGQVS